MCTNLFEIEKCDQSKLLLAEPQPRFHYLIQFYLFDRNSWDILFRDVLPQKERSLFELVCAQLVEVSYRKACCIIFKKNHYANAAHEQFCKKICAEKHSKLKELSRCVRALFEVGQRQLRPSGGRRIRREDAFDATSSCVVEFTEWF